MEKSRKKLQFEKNEKLQHRKNAKNKHDTIVELTKTALFSAVFCVLSPHTLYLFLPFSPVGVTFGSFLVYLAGLLLGIRGGCISVLIYLGLGFLGLPVFAGYQAGAGVLFGPTGGFLLGYLPCVWEIGFLMQKAKKIKRGELRFFAGMILGTLLLYLCGVIWFCLVYTKDVTLKSAVMACVLPFLPFDGIKIAVAMILYKPLQRLRQS